MIERLTMSRVARSPRLSYSNMKRSPAASVSQPPEPRRPSSSTVPVMRVPSPASSPGGMELHHLDVAQRQAGAQRHRQAVAGFVA